MHSLRDFQHVASRITFAIAVSLSVLSIGVSQSLADAQETQPCKATPGEAQDISREDLESRLSALLSRGENDGVSHNATFEGCVLVQRLNYDENQQKFRGYNYIEKKSDVRLLETDLCKVRAENADKERYTNEEQISVIYQPRPEYLQRLLKLEAMDYQIANEETKAFPEDVAARLNSIARRQKDELQDKIYLNAGTGTYFNGGIWTFSPETISILTVSLGREDELMELMDAYGRLYCGDKPAD
ncbi:hypothetical protein [uncultured Roseibium sp.]|uniref:hypothetical protein n=1 Tax=uncultured Roseibium sp. TaxID=1936171 RepID=UPI00321708B1